MLHGHARLASGWWSSLAGWDSNPLGPFVKFQSCPLHGVLLTQASPGAPKPESEAACRRSGIGSGQTVSSARAMRTIVAFLVAACSFCATATAAAQETPAASVRPPVALV